MNAPEAAVHGIIRLANRRDGSGVAAIYAPFVRETAITFETEPPTAADFESRIEDTLQSHAWLVAVQQDRVVGYAYATKHRPRAAYRWAVDVSVYIDSAFHRRGLGRRLYEELLKLVRAQGFYMAYAGITLPNAGSVGLHESLGFRSLCVYQRVGHKLGAWRDVGWWELALRKDETPAEALPVGAVIDADWQVSI